MGLTYKFKMREDLKDKLCVFNVENLAVEKDCMDYDDVVLVIGSNPYHGEFQSFSTNSVPTEDVFETVVNSFLRNDTETFEYVEGWEAFDKLKAEQVYRNGLLMEFPQIFGDTAEIYKLDLAIDEWKYYSCDENVMLLTAGNGISTNYEFFYNSALVDDLEKIDKGASYIYMSDDLKKYMPEILGK